nr:MAG TPA_asm: tail tube protein [Caudoviricetes sp.]
MKFRISTSRYPENRKIYLKYKNDIRVKLPFEPNIIKIKQIFIGTVGDTDMAKNGLRTGQQNKAGQSGGGFARGYNFQVFFDDCKMSFARVSGIERSVATESFCEGGMNHRSYIKRNANRTEHVMNFERGYAVTDSGNGLQLKAGMQFSKDVCIYVTNEASKPVKAYYLSGAVIRKIDVGDFDAMRSELLIEKIEIVYELLNQENM